MAKRLVIRKPGATGDWLYSHGGTEHGPLVLAEFKQAAADGRLHRDDLVWRVDNPVRVQAGWLPWLFPPAAGAGAADAPDTTADAERLTCAACHAAFASVEALYIARQPDLPPDPVLGPGNALRFLPARFTPDGAAIDPGGEVAAETACPVCHAALAPAAAAGPARPGVRLARDKDAFERLPPALATLEGVERLVKDITGILNRSSSTRLLGDVVARQYAEVCRRAAARLGVCQRFLADGQRQEATQAASERPRLTDLCARLPFDELDQWRQLCARNRWPAPAAVDPAAVEAVAAACRESAPFEPVLRMLRHAARRRRTPDAICALRTLMLMDEDNLNWGVDAADFEGVRQQELLVAARVAVDAGDLPALGAAVAELTGQWVVPPDPAAVAPLAEALQHLRRRDAVSRGSVLAARFARACSERDFTAASQADAAWRALLAEGSFQPDVETSMRYASGSDWYEAENARRAAEAAFQRDCQALQAAVGQAPDATAVGRLAAAVRASGRSDLPAELLARADAIVAEDARRRAARALRRRLLRIAAVAVPAVAVAAGLALTVFARQRGLWAGRLQRALEAEDVARFDEIRADMRRLGGGMLGAALDRSRPVAALRGRRDEAAGRLQGRSAAFAAAAAELARLRAGGFTSPAERVAALLDQARAGATGDAQRASLGAIESAWRADQTARLESLLAQLPAAQPPADLFAAQPFGEAVRTAARFGELADASRALRGADPAGRGRLAPYLAPAAAVRSNLDARVAAVRAATEAKEFDAFLDALVRYASRFPSDALARGLDPALKARADYRAALQAAADAARRRAEIAASDAWPRARRAIGALQENRTLTDLRWVRRKDTGDLVLLLGREKREEGFRGEWGQIYQPLGTDLAPSFRRERVLDDLPYAQGLSVEPSRPFRHADIVRGILDKVTAIRDAAEGASFLEDQIRRLATLPVWRGSGAPDLNDLPNVAFEVQFLAFFAEQMTHLSPHPEWSGILAALREADHPEVNWICLRNGDIQKVDRIGARALTRIFGAGGLIARLDARRAALDVADRTPLVWAGHADLLAPGIVRWRTAKPPAEYAVLRADATGRRNMLVIAGGGDAPPRIALVAGEPVLAWADGAATAPKVASVARAFGAADDAAVLPLLPPWFPR